MASGLVTATWAFAGASSSIAVPATALEEEGGLGLGFLFEVSTIIIADWRLLKWTSKNCIFVLWCSKKKEFRYNPSTLRPGFWRSYMVY